MVVRLFALLLFFLPSALFAQSQVPSSKDIEQGFRTIVWWVGTAFEVAFALIAILVVLHFSLKISRKSAEGDAWAKLSLDGPMQVNIEEQFTPAGTFNSKQVPCGLRIDVKISQNDWRAIADAGLMKKVLFEGDGPSGQQYDPENVRPWLVEDLKLPTFASFWDADRMHAAKERLIEGLYDLREHIDQRRHGSKKETLQI